MLNSIMDITAALIKHFGSGLIAKNKDNIPELIELIEKKIEDLRTELDYLTMMVNYGNVMTFDKDPEEAYCCSDDCENAALVITMTTLKIKELESSLVALRQLETTTQLNTAHAS